MKTTRAFGVAVLTVFLVCGFSSASLAGGDVNFLLGTKMLNDDWDPAQDHFEVGAQISFGKEDWPVLIAIDVLSTADNEGLTFGLELEASTVEVDLGVRKIWESGKARPFVGGGLAIILAEAKIGSFTENETGAGAWVDGGIFWRLGERFNIGVEARVSRAKVSTDFANGDIEAGGEHVTLILGWGW